MPEIFAAAHRLDAAVSAHLEGRPGDAEALIALADDPAITEWTEALWGKGGPWTKPLNSRDALPHLSRDMRVPLRMPDKAQQRLLLLRDGFHCRFCGIPLIRAVIRTALNKHYPKSARWGSRNADQHAGLQVMWLQFDHLVPHARGGDNDLSNVVVTCAPCNNGRSNLTLDEVGLADPRLRPAVRTSWDGLERLLAKSP